MSVLISSELSELISIPPEIIRKSTIILEVYFGDHFLGHCAINHLVFIVKHCLQVQYA